jgi:trehalose 6-phosphate phosphatase
VRNILARRHARILEEFAATNVLMAFDFDGTLAPLVASPAKARMRRTTIGLLRQLARVYPCIVISGRARADVLARLPGIPMRGVIGNHGAEPFEDSRRTPKQVARWRPLLEQTLSRFPGVRIEDKGLSMAVHYRRSREKERARAAILQAAAELGAVRIIGGAQVVNILPKGTPHKGVALETARERLGCATAVYVGDDETDEDVFGLNQPARLLSIRVGANPASGASFAIRSQAEVDELLRVLVGLRASSSSSARESQTRRIPQKRRRRL